MTNDTLAFSPSHIPPVCGFNLLEKFLWTPERPAGLPFSEWDFDFIAREGFKFVRLPMDYRTWTRDLDGPRRDIDQAVLAEIVAAVEMGKARGLHVSVNIHRGPGYCINQAELEPFNLWTDPVAQECFVHHWAALAQALRGFSNQECSLDLLNEPPNYDNSGFTPQTHRHVMGLAASAIRQVSPGRLIFCDGHDGGHSPSPELLDLGVAQSCRGYVPFQITHYQAPWLGLGDDFPWPAPAWPINEEGDIPGFTGPWNAELLKERVYGPWKELEAQGVGIHCGELGVFNRTDAEVTYAFMDDLLGVLNDLGWGWALWNLRGAFGVLDNRRPGVKTEPHVGHELDRRLLDILKKHNPV